MVPGHVHFYLLVYGKKTQNPNSGLQLDNIKRIIPQPCNHIQIKWPFHEKAQFCLQNDIECYFANDYFKPEQRNKWYSVYQHQHTLIALKTAGKTSKGENSLNKRIPSYVVQMKYL